MNCKRIKELILTDYLDRETAGSVHKQVETHLAACADCRAFELRVRETASRPFRTLKPVEPPEQLWLSIKGSIETEQQAATAPGDERYAPSFPDRLGDLLRGIFAVRKPAFAFATALSLLVLTVLVSQPMRRQQSLVKDYLQEQRMFLASADRPYSGVLDEDFSLGTKIEKYLF